MKESGLENHKSKIPEEWEWCKLGEIADAQPGFACGRKDVPNGLIHLRMNNIGDDCYLNLDLIRRVPLEYKNEKYLLRKNDLLFCHTNSSKLVGKNAIFDLEGDYAYSNHLTRLRASGAILPKWLGCILSVYWRKRYFENKCKHWVNQSTLPKEELVRFPIPLPPLPEQRLIIFRVEALLERVKKAKEYLDKVPRIIKQFRQAVLKKAFSGELTAEWREKNPNLEPATELLKSIQEERKRQYEEATKAKLEGKRLPKKPKNLESKPLDTSNLPESPDGWVWSRLGSLITISSGKFIRRAEYSPILEDDNNPYLVAGAGGPIGKTNKKNVDGPVIILGRVGACGALNLYQKGIWATDNTLVVKPVFMEQISYLAHFLTKVTWSSIISGTSQPLITQSIVNSLVIPLPSLPEQKEIVRRVEALFKFADGAEKRVEQAKEQVEKITQSVLSRAFKGELTEDFRMAVKNWKILNLADRGKYLFTLPEDEQNKALHSDKFLLEPASVLLERIREIQPRTEKMGNRKDREETKQIELWRK